MCFSSQYLEVETNANKNLWLGRIRFNPATNRMAGSSPVDCAASQITVSYNAEPGSSGYFRYRIAIPLALLPGAGSRPNLYATFLRIAHVDTTWTQQKELTVRS